MTLNSFPALDQTVVGVAPCRTDVDELREYLSGMGERRYQYVAVLAMVATTVRQLVKSHQACTTAGCMTCWELRYAGAALGAVDIDSRLFRAFREGAR